MKRFTYISDGYPAVKNNVCYEDQNEDYCGPAIDCLAAYEDTGLTSAEIKSLIAEYKVNLTALNIMRNELSNILSNLKGLLGDNYIDD